MFTNLETLLRPRVRLRKQVLHFFIVDFDHTNRDLQLYFLGGICLDGIYTLKDLIASSRHDTFILTIAHHRIALS